MVNIAEILVLAAGGIGLGYLFLTDDGKKLVAQISRNLGINGSSSDEDPFLGLREALGEAKEKVTSGWEDIVEDYKRQVRKDPEAFSPGSERWKEIIRKSRGEEEAERLAKALQKDYLVAYLAEIH